jgi:tubulin delta
LVAGKGKGKGKPELVLPPIKMSVVTLQLGQCGNQVGGELFSCLSQEAPTVFFRKRENKKRQGYGGSAHVARAVLVDMEPKAIEATLKRPKEDSVNWAYDEKVSFWNHSGSANNWSYGYSVHGPASSDAVLELTRRQAEHCDHLSGFHLLNSLAGGTGSGVGAYTAELLRDNFPKARMLNTVVWPYTSGDVIVQGYNSILTLSHLLRVSDGKLSNTYIVDVANTFMLRAQTNHRDCDVSQRFSQRCCHAATWDILA